MVKLDAVFKDFNTKPDDKKKDEKKTITVISGEKDKPETIEPIKKNDIFPVQPTQSQITPPPVPAPAPLNLPPIPPAKTTPKTSVEFDYSEEASENKHAGLIYGLKGSGKTSLAFSFPGTHVCISFDKKSTSIKENLSETDKKRIRVFDGTRYLDKSSSESWLISSDTSWKYINNLLNKLKSESDRPDWVVIDGGEIFETMAEMVMRYRNQLQPFQGISNLNIWKERRLYIDQLYRQCFSLSRKGLIWTSYTTREPEYKDGNIINSKDIPKWLDVVLTETEWVIKVERETDKTRQTFYATVETSKWKILPCSPKLDITEIGVKKLARGDL